MAVARILACVEFNGGAFRKWNLPIGNSRTVDDPEILLRSGAWRAVVSSLGASLRRLWIEEQGKSPQELIWGYSGTLNKRGGQGDVLMPFPGRVKLGAYRFDGVQHQLPCNDKEGPNAIHGFLRGLPWERGAGDERSQQFKVKIGRNDHPGYPFEIEATLTYSLGPSGLACTFYVVNAGRKAAPLGVGFHPYLKPAAALDEATLELPAASIVELQDLIPTGRVMPVPQEMDFRVARSVGTLRLNDCFTALARDAEGKATVRLGEVELWMDPAFDYVVLYTGDSLGPDARRGLAVEPMTCAPDAFNHPQWGLQSLAAKQSLEGAWGIRVHRSA